MALKWLFVFFNLKMVNDLLLVLLKTVSLRRETIKQGTMSEKYKMFKQFMHNELGITKEDIREWVKESVREEAAKMVAKTYEDFDVKREIREVINSPYNSIRKDLVNACAAEIIKDFKLVYKPSAENQAIEELTRKVEALQRTVGHVASKDIKLGPVSCI